MRCSQPVPESGGRRTANRLASLPRGAFVAALISFYEEMARRDPESWVPPAALRALQHR